MEDMDYEIQDQSYFDRDDDYNVYEENELQYDREDFDRTEMDFGVDDDEGWNDSFEDRFIDSEWDY